ncbi:MAG: hypothetical protein M5U26_22255 [Planctomycetota bacterium]|nr:hypothetical protein [Planctomycetota bacterium]
MLLFRIPRPSVSEWDATIRSPQRTPRGTPFVLELTLKGGLAAHFGAPPRDGTPGIRPVRLKPTGRRDRLRAEIGLEDVEAGRASDAGGDLVLPVDMDAEGLEELLRWQDRARALTRGQG